MRRKIDPEMGVLIARIIHDGAFTADLAKLLGVHRTIIWRTAKRYGGPVPYKKRWNHGTTTGYKTHKCRCDKCRGAWNTYSRRLYHRTKAKKRETWLDTAQRLSEPAQD